MSPPPEPPDRPAGNAARFRWQALFQEACEPLFLLNRRRRILFVNRAWETLTGLGLADVKGHVCRRRPPGSQVETLDVVLGALAPPSEVDQGRPAQVRRLVSLKTGAAWWELHFFPLAGGDGLAGVLGKISVLAGLERPAGQPLSEKMVALRQRHAQHYRLEEMVSNAPAMQRLREQIRLAAQTRLPVLLVGAAGTGKRWVARAIHHLGPDREKTFACLDCAGLPVQLLAALLFAAGPPPPLAGLYLHNLAALPRDLQERLRQRLEMNKEQFPRICAGLEQDPRELVQSGKLLDELYCLLSPLVVQLPALKERADDFAGWVDRLSPRASRAAGRPLRGVSSEAALLLKAHAWPGNLRELYDVLMGACLRAKGEQIEPADLPFYLRHAPAPADKPMSLDAILEEVERRLIVQALRLAKNNKSRAAELLAIWRDRLLRRMKSLGITEDGLES